jgi:Cu(I)/Ag(I) efflux system membrane protein CusA/SilA
MKPLATPVLGGMVSSLILVLIVTPVLFSWLRERELDRAEPVTEPHTNKEGSMGRVIAVIALTMAMLGTGLAGSVGAQGMKVVQTQKTKDAVITLKSESGQWKQGPNAFVLEFTSPDGKPLDAGKATLSTSMAMPGMAPMIAGATLSPDKAPGRYAGTISFPDGGARQVTVTWDGPGGKGSAKFSVPVR